MKKMKKVLCLLLAAVITVSMGLAVNGQEAQAADKLKAPKAMRCGVGQRNSNYVRLPIASKTDVIKNIKVYKGKSKSKNLVIKKTYKSLDETNPYVGYSIYAKKAGKYTVKYNVYNGKKKGKTKKFTVHAKGYGDAIASVSINKKNVTKFNANYYPVSSYYTSKSKIKIKFKAAAGCKIKKVTMSYYDKNGKYVTKTIKNGKTVKLGAYGESYSSNYSWSKDTYARTEFTVYYVDKYDQYDYENGEMASDTYYVYKKAKKWYKETY